MKNKIASVMVFAFVFTLAGTTFGSARADERLGFRESRGSTAIDLRYREKQAAYLTTNSLRSVREQAEARDTSTKAGHHKDAPPTIAYLRIGKENAFRGARSLRNEREGHIHARLV